MQIDSNGKQDKIEQYPSSGKAGKSKKKKILIILGMIIVIIALLLFLPATGQPTPGMAMKMRCNALAGWYEHVRPYMNENNQNPLSLIEICQAEYRKDQRSFPHAGLSNDQFPEKWALDWNLVNDPDRFKKEVPYGLFQNSEGWFIRELVPGRLYKKMLMIDQDGKIYELREIPKEKYEYPK